jgi:ABC-type Fe3+-hydroxamate transport system substrate-binding protein
MKVVSLVPSVTQSIFDLGLGDTLTGVTEFCILPPEQVGKVNRIGSPKQVNLELIRHINPDFIFCNQEENSQGDVEELKRDGLNVVLQFPKTVEQAFQDLWEIARLLNSQAAVTRVDMLERAWEWFRASVHQQRPVRVFCPIWQPEENAGQKWWMTFNGNTYPGDIIRAFGGINIFETRQRRYPLEAELGLRDAEEPGLRDTRYPRVVIDEIIAGQPELILLPSEPYLYTNDHIQSFLNEFSNTKAGQRGNIRMVDGKLLMWHGTYIARAMSELTDFFLFNERM